MVSLSRLKNRFGQPEEREVASNSWKVYNTDLVFQNLSLGMHFVGRRVVEDWPLTIQETCGVF
jgi:hypothetical protein